MTPVTLERPTHSESKRDAAAVLGNDGLTDQERQELAAAYLAGPARRRLSDSEKVAIREALGRRSA